MFTVSTTPKIVFQKTKAQAENMYTAATVGVKHISLSLSELYIHNKMTLYIAIKQQHNLFTY